MEFVLWSISAIVNYFIIVTIVDFILMGIVIPCFAAKCHFIEFIIEKKNRFDYQKNLECAAFSSAYVLRHFGIEAHGEELYKNIPGKMQAGTVYPKGVCKLLSQYGLKVRYKIGNLNTLKNEVTKGNPVIVFIRMQEGSKNLHYVPVVGYDEKYIYIAESEEPFANCKKEFYNRKVEVADFKKLWNTSMLKMPLYFNTYFTVEK